MSYSVIDGLVYYTHEFPLIDNLRPQSNMAIIVGAVVFGLTAGYLLCSAILPDGL